MPTWLVVVFTILGGAAALKILHALAIVVVHPITQGAMYTSTGRVKIRKALDAVTMKPGELLVDIGCGDGRVLRAARKRYGVRCLGFEINPIAFTKAKLLTMGRKGLEVRCRNFWKADLGKADIVSCYLFPDVMRRLGAKLGKELASGARVISFNFPIPGWKHEAVLRADSKLHNDPIYIYTIPDSLPDSARQVVVKSEGAVQQKP
ncbi:MAG TPA: class I SAM-dependent methyltransferase [Syntrophales bacterium]|nr:class I SAM-dependent methyltransferase [Syntrophales bacterium]